MKSFCFLDGCAAARRRLRNEVSTPKMVRGGLDPFCYVIIRRSSSATKDKRDVTPPTKEMGSIDLHGLAHVRQSIYVLERVAWVRPIDTF